MARNFKYKVACRNDSDNKEVFPDALVGIPVGVYYRMAVTTWAQGRQVHGEAVLCTVKRAFGARYRWLMCKTMQDHIKCEWIEVDVVCPSIHILAQSSS